MGLSCRAFRRNILFGRERRDKRYQEKRDLEFEGTKNNLEEKKENSCKERIGKGGNWLHRLEWGPDDLYLNGGVLIYLRRRRMRKLSDATSYGVEKKRYRRSRGKKAKLVSNLQVRMMRREKGLDMEKGGKGKEEKKLERFSWTDEAKKVQMEQPKNTETGG